MFAVPRRQRQSDFPASMLAVLEDVVGSVKTPPPNHMSHNRTGPNSTSETLNTTPFNPYLLLPRLRGLFSLLEHLFGAAWRHPCGWRAFGLQFKAYGVATCSSPTTCRRSKRSQLNFSHSLPQKNTEPPYFKIFANQPC